VDGQRSEGKDEGVVVVKGEVEKKTESEIEPVQIIFRSSSDKNIL
jgi:hypothetical protein